MHVLMVTIGYPPHQVGGTEVYVHGLVEALKDQGVRSSVVYVDTFADDEGPDFQLSSHSQDGTDVHTIGVNTTRHKLEFTMFDEKLRGLLLREFRLLINRLNPDIIHVHPLQLGIESYLIEELNSGGKNVVLTFHSSTTTCARGDLIYMGQEVCDGLVTQAKCSKCLYHWKSVPAPIATGLSYLPPTLLRPVHSRLGESLRKFRSIISIPLTIEERRKAWKRSTDNSRRVVAVCHWVRETIIKNGVSQDKVVFSRHGLRIGTTTNGLRSGRTRFGYLGRISPEKGIDLVLEVLRQLPKELDFEFEFCSASFKGANRPEELTLVNEIREFARQDRRVKVLDGVNDNQLRSVLAGWDAMVVPSRWLESGPQVIYESFAVQTPVIGSRLGGIAELVREDETGFLFKPGSTAELYQLLSVCIANPEVLRKLRLNIGPVRTTHDVAVDMIKVYESLIASEARESRGVIAG